jgi:hypothetical protein
MPEPLTLISLTGGEVIEFTRFPPQIETEDEANWEEQDVQSRTKPLIYANRNPQNITIDDLLLDKSETHDSVLGEIEQLRNLMKEHDGAPSPVQMIVGAWWRRVVLQSMRVRMEMFTPEGRCIRARVSLTFKEHQAREEVTVNVTEDFPEQ